MIKIQKQHQQLYKQLKQIQTQMRKAAQQSQVFKNSMIIIQRSIKKNQLTIKQLQKISEDRGIYVPLGKAFLKRDKTSTIKQFVEANKKLSQSTVDIEKNYKYFTEKANQKQQLLKQGSQRLIKASQPV